MIVFTEQFNPFCDLPLDGAIRDECQGELASLFECGEDIDPVAARNYWVNQKCEGAFRLADWWAAYSKPPIRLAKDVERINPILRGLVEHRKFDHLGIIASKFVPLPLPILGINSDSLVFLSGSWIYGLQDPTNVDFDLTVIAPGGIRRDNLQAYVRFLPEDQLAHKASHGHRHAWEVLKANNDCVIQDNTEQRRRFDGMIRFIETRPDHPQIFEQGTAEYFNEYAPFLNKKVCEVSDPSIRSWIAEKGWAYKLGYYIFVDAILSRDAQGCGTYDPRYIFQSDERIRRHVLRCKRGEMDFSTFESYVSPWLPEEGVCWFNDRGHN